MGSHRGVRVAAALLVFLAAFAGATGERVSASHAQGEYFDLDRLPGIDTTGKQIADTLSQFVDDHPYRFTGGPTELKAAETLRAEMASLGYQTEVKPLPLREGTPAVSAGPLRVVTAMKRGTTRPDEWIMLVGHYDTIASTVDGAYDNGAGTNMLRFLAREIADVPTNRSVVFAWYNAEEEGLLASEQHAAQLKAAGQNITAVLGFDMVGIGYPVQKPGAANCMCMYHGKADANWAKPLLQHVNYNFLGFPAGKTTVDIAGANIRNSDEVNFERRGYRVLRWTGMRRAADYPAYHRPDDTMATIDSVAGGRPFFEQGSLNTLRSAYYSLLAIDNHLPVPAANATITGATASFDASASVDPDGALDTYRWDFGDGTTGEGATATHTYSTPGTYTARLMVEDNLWPDVQRALALTVTVD